jgi:hypothetical protein
MTNESERPRTGESEAAPDDGPQHHHSTMPVQSNEEPEPQVFGLPPGVVTLQESLAELARVLPRLKAALDHAARPAEPAVAYRKKQSARLLGICPRLLERLLAAGKFPEPDAYAGRCPLWTRRTLEAWVATGGSR